MQQHINELKEAVDTDPMIDMNKKEGLKTSINNIQKSITAKLDEMEALGRELLQLVRIFWKQAYIDKY